MRQTKAVSIFSYLIVILMPLLIFMPTLSKAQDSAPPGVVPLHKPRPGQWAERVRGDPDKPGEPFVIRIHADAGYIILPHTHLVDENIVVVQGVWALGMGPRFSRSALEQLEVGPSALRRRTRRTSPGQRRRRPYKCTGSGRFLASSSIRPMS